MKTLLILLTAVSLGHTNDAFTEGFARGLQSAIEARNGYQSQQRAPSYQPRTLFFTPIDNYGKPSQYQFATLSQCRQYIANSSVFVDCARITE